MIKQPAFHASISDYWNEQFPVAPTSISSVGIAKRPDLDSDLRIMILERPNGETRAVMTPGISDQLGFLPDDGLSPAQS